MTNVLTPRNALGAVSIPDGVAGPSRCARFPTIADDSVGLIHAQGPLGAALLLTLCVSTLFAQPITITAGNATAKRQAILTRIFGSASLPTALPTTITTDVGPPADLTPAGILLANLERVDRLEFSMSGRADNVEEKNIAYHLIPLRKNNRLVVLNPGHACSYVEQLATDPTSDYGYGDLRTLNGLLREGYSVLATYMPHVQPNQCTGNHNAEHNALMGLAMQAGQGSPLRFFFEPIARSLNYLKTKAAVDAFPQYTEFDFVGLSGGGWTGTVYAAIDPTIKVTTTVSGSIPLYLRSGGSVGDLEQTLNSFYVQAGYPDLYVLGSFGLDRRQIQILNRHDNCCFSEDFHNATLHGPWQTAMRNTERDVRTALFNMAPTVGAPVTGAGFFRQEIDESALHHEISWHSIVNTITAELNHARRPVGAASSSNAFVRGLNGNLWRWTATAWTDTGLAMVGAPAVLEGAIHPIDVFYRDPGNLLMHAFEQGPGNWVTQPMGGHLVVDPVVARSGSNRVFVAGLGYDYGLYSWSIPGSGTFTRVSGTTFKGLGQPAISVDSNAVYLYSRGHAGKLYCFQSNNGGAPASWTQHDLGGDNADFPSATQIGATSLAYVRDVRTSHFIEFAKTGMAAWIKTDISAAAAAGTLALTGSPSVSVAGSTIWVNGRDTSGNLVRFRRPAQATPSQWTLSTQPLAAGISGAPLAIGSQTYVRETSGQLLRFDGTNWVRLAGLINF